MKHAALAKRASDENGGPTELARKVGVSPSFVSQWISGLRWIPKDVAPEIERVSSVTRQQLYPDTWKKRWPELEMIANTAPSAIENDEVAHD